LRPGDAHQPGAEQETQSQAFSHSVHVSALHPA
jgi:hypothetical protein